MMFYVFGAYTTLTFYHVIFEVRTSMLRCPDKGWNPLSISERSVTAKTPQKVIDFILRQELLDVLSDFIGGEIKPTEARLYAKRS